jgi:hypothetical protein
VGEGALSLVRPGEMFRGILKRKGDEIAEEPRKLHNDYLRDSPTIIRLFNVG